MSYVLIVCAAMLAPPGPPWAGKVCVTNYFAFKNYGACEHARTDLMKEAYWAKCEPKSTVAVPDLEPEND